MSSVLDLIVGDTGVTLAGTLTQEGLGTLTDLTGVSVTFSLLRVADDALLINNANALVAGLDTAHNSVQVSYRLQAQDVANPVDLAKVRWTLQMPDGGKIHGPGPQEQQTFIRINA